MLYHVLHIKTDFAEKWQRDVFDQSLCELGVDTIDGEDYYIQSEVLEANRSAITDFLSPFNFQFSIDSCPDENWNAAWEAEHPIQELPLGIRIIPHCAFGAGHHETTAMMINELMNFKFQISNFKFNVLDHGTGTGVLAIYAKHLGAERVVAVDIDEKSVENAKENAELNNEVIDVRLGSSVPEGIYDLILANIHRNVLLATMHAYASHLSQNGKLWISGFYEEDCPVLEEAAEKVGLKRTATYVNNEWRMLCFIKQ